MKKGSNFTIPNVITSMRIVGAICLLFTKPLSIPFFVIYTLAGISDVVDGWIARTTKCTSELGSKLDSIADLLFYSIMAIQIFPFLLRDLPIALWCVAGTVILIRIITYIYVAVKYHQFASIHTYMNKATGFVVFALPYFIACAKTVLICSVLGVVSGVATIEELLIHIRSKSYRTDVKTIF